MLTDQSNNHFDLKGLTPSQIDDFCTTSLGQKPGQGTRVAIQLFRKRRQSFDEMTDLNRSFREELKRHCTLSSLFVEKRVSSDDGTIKLLYGLHDGNTVEGVVIPGPGGRCTLCVSSQVGCASGCLFCLTGTGGLIRNLTIAEMVNQLFAAQNATGASITNIVLMGSGEPLHNYDAVKSFVTILTDRNGMGYSPKKVTLSTCGIIPGIERMATEMNVSLAVSLNAATDELRNRLMPLNRTYPVAALMQAVRSYCGRSGNTVTIEYVLFKGVNDSDDDAGRLMRLLEGLPCMINILMFNPFPGAELERPDEERGYAFRNILLKNGYVAVVRNSRGADIFAACGQLRAASSNGNSRSTTE